MFVPQQLFKKVVLLGRSERRGESYFGLYGESSKRRENNAGGVFQQLRYSLAMRSLSPSIRFSVDCLMKIMFSARCCWALIFPSSRRFC